ncbi:MAG: preprotein translocase subunit SecG [Bacteroidota bacterium]|nr:preprotein translocase subunit SecG [Bacteroidota bacterium]
MLYTLFAILIIITCILLILIIMIQNPKGGGLSSAFGGGNQIMGARKTSDFLEKTTWTLAIVLVSLALLSNFSIPRNSSDEESIINFDEPNDESIEDFDIENEMNFTDTLN